MVIPRAFFLRERCRFDRKLCSTTEFFSQNSSQSSSQSGFTMVNVTDGANVYVRFATFKFSLAMAISYNL